MTATRWAIAASVVALAAALVVSALVDVDATSARSPAEQRWLALPPEQRAQLKSDYRRLVELRDPAEPLRRARAFERLSEPRRERLREMHETIESVISSLDSGQQRIARQLPEPGRAMLVYQSLSANQPDRLRKLAATATPPE